MALMKALIDTNVCLDAAQRRKPFASAAVEILAQSENGTFTGYLSAHSFDTIFYILRKHGTKKSAYHGIEGLRKTIKIAPVSTKIIDQALAAEWDDFEDAIHYYAAKEAGCEAIITRNSSDFKQGELSVLSPIQFLKRLDQ